MVNYAHAVHISEAFFNARTHAQEEQDDRQALLRQGHSVPQPRQCGPIPGYSPNFQETGIDFIFSKMYF